MVVMFRRRRSWEHPPRPPLPPLHRQRLDGWVAMLDVDLELAQRMLRLPPSRLPVPPLAMPAVLSADGVVLAPAVDAPLVGEAAPEVPAARVELRGAYARRAAQKRGSG